MPEKKVGVKYIQHEGERKNLPSETWEDLGYSAEKPSKKLALFRIPQSPIPNHQHESQERTESRKAKAILAILAVIPDAELKENGMVVGKVKNRLFEFYPASDCWYSAAKSKFGYGIKELCQMIVTHLAH